MSNTIDNFVIELEKILDDLEFMATITSCIHPHDAKNFMTGKEWEQLSSFLINTTNQISILTHYFFNLNLQKLNPTCPKTKAEIYRLKLTYSKQENEDEI